MLRPAAQLILASVATCVHIGAVASEAEFGTCQLSLHGLLPYRYQIRNPAEERGRVRV
jgi:hypothetical protein